MKALSKIVEKFLRKEKLGAFVDAEKTEKNSLFENWPDIVGKDLAIMTRPYRLDRNKLFIYIDNSAIMNEMTYKKSALKKAVNSHLKQKQITDIIFRIKQ